MGETLSTYDENTRDFMFPGPNQISGHHDSNRQVTMRRISGLRVSAYCFLNQAVMQGHGQHPPHSPRYLKCEKLSQSLIWFKASLLYYYFQHTEI